VPDLVDRLDGRLAEAVSRLRWAAAARGKLRDARRLLGPGPEGAPEAVPLVRQVLSKILLQVSAGGRGQVRELGPGPLWGSYG
jgi:hypothetical protein